jgi:succinyl-diaminopimelate desuccinylase
MSIDLVGHVDLVEATQRLVAIPSVSHEEELITAHIEERLRAVSWLDVTRVGNSLVARTQLGRPSRLILAGHTDTVPVNGNAVPRREGNRLHGLGTADMKSGLAVFLYLAETMADPSCDLTFVFYECEEVASVHNGLRRLLAERPELLQGDAAILGEPTCALLEAGCQGSMRLRLTLGGARAHTARPWMGRNAVHRLAPVLAGLAGYAERRPMIDGCEYREALSAVGVDGGVAGNVVPDRVVLTLNHRFAPDRNAVAAEEHVRGVLGAELLADDATLEVVDVAEGALPSLGHPLLARLAAEVGAPPRAKLGWTDVAFFAAHGVPAVNFGPGDPTIAHTAGEFVDGHEIDAVCSALVAVMR